MHKSLVICHQYHNLVCCDAAALNNSSVPDNFVVLDDSQIEKCFTVLVEEARDVWMWCHHGLRPVVEYCMQHYIYIKAAGGLVQSPKKQHLLIYRNERWDLPKGKVEAGETLAEAALREVEEETGVQQLALGRLALKTYHIYNLYGGWHFKQTSWFEMTTTDDSPILPQTEEGITSGEWVDLDTWRQRLNNSYATMQLIANQYE